MDSILIGQEWNREKQLFENVIVKIILMIGNVLI